MVVRFTANFEANLASIEAFLTDAELLHDYDRLLDELGDVGVPNLERFPAMGRPFLAHTPASVEARSMTDRLRAPLAEDSDIREYVLDDYLILYALVGDNVYLLSIKHQRQLSFDLKRFWGGER